MPAEVRLNEIILQPLLAGLSTGLFCSAYCLPVVAPFLVAEERTPRASMKLLLEFLAGRLAGYMVFGAVVGYLGERLQEYHLGLVSAAALVVLSALLIAYGLGLIRPRLPLCMTSERARRSAPLAMGFLMGINVCPPFLLSITYVFTLGSAFKGIAYFLVFFAATTVYFLPMAFLGFLTRMKEFRVVARISAVLVGVLFAAYGIHAVWSGVAPMHSP